MFFGGGVECRHRSGASDTCLTPRHPFLLSPLRKVCPPPAPRAPQCDPELHRYLMALQEPALEVPYFALRCAHRGRRAAPQAERPVASFFGCACTDPALPLNGTAPEWMVLPPCSWYMTWFAHDVPSLPQIARLFDLFLSSHPLMPLYLAAVAIKASERWRGGCRGGGGGRGRRWVHACPHPCGCLALRRPAVTAVPPRLLCLLQGNRRQVLECGEDGLQAYAALKSMRFLQPGQPSADELAQQAAALYQAVPPAQLARQRGIELEHSAAIDAYLWCAWGLRGGGANRAVRLVLTVPSP